MPLKRIVRNGWAGVLAVALAAGLAGCTPMSAGYVVNLGAGEPLELRSVCDDERFTSVLVRYAIDGDPEANFDQEPIWSVEFEEGSEPAVVLLFQDNPGGVAKFGQVDIDWDREMAVIGETESGRGHGVAGNLSGLAAADVIWQRGVEGLDVFEQKLSKRDFGC
jgi:hypothetical protein